MIIYTRTLILMILAVAVSGCRNNTVDQEGNTVDQEDISTIYSNVDFKIVNDSIRTEYGTFPIINIYNQIYFFSGKVVYVYQMSKNNFVSLDFYENKQTQDFGRIVVDNGIPYSITISPLLTSVGVLLSSNRVPVDSARVIDDEVFLYLSGRIVSPDEVLD